MLGPAWGETMVMEEIHINRSDSQQNEEGKPWSHRRYAHSKTSSNANSRLNCTMVARYKSPKEAIERKNRSLLGKGKARRY